jgi:hypothetical protein
MRFPWIGGTSVSAMIMALSLIGSAPAFAQSDTDENQQLSQPGSDAIRIKELERRLNERDAVIRELLRRTKRLEELYRQEHAASAPTTRQNTKAVLTPAPNKRKRRASNGLLQSEHNDVAFIPDAQVTQTVNAQTTPNSNQQPASANAPGQFTVTPEQAQHALELALEQTGALLLQPWKLQLVPSQTYEFTQVSRPDQIVLTAAGSLFASQDVLRTTLLQSQLLLRAGLPWDSQVEISSSYDYSSLSTTSQFPLAFLGNHTVQGFGVGDTTLSLIKQITKESDWVPSIFISGSGNIGQQDNGLLLGSGYDWVRGAITAVKRQDPLVFTAGFSYQNDFVKNGLVPGNQFSPTVGMIFAVSPETSLQFNQQLTFVQNYKLRGAILPGSGQLEGIFQAGVLSILAPGLVANLTVAVGETPDAPNLTIVLSFPITFN